MAVGRLLLDAWSGSDQLVAALLVDRWRRSGPMNPMNLCRT
jgi:hypothetical protein